MNGDGGRGLARGKGERTRVERERERERGLWIVVKVCLCRVVGTIHSTWVGTYPQLHIVSHRYLLGKYLPS